MRIQLRLPDFFDICSKLLDVYQKQSTTKREEKMSDSLIRALFLALAGVEHLLCELVSKRIVTVNNLDAFKRLVELLKQDCQNGALDVHELDHLLNESAAAGIDTRSYHALD